MWGPGKRLGCLVLVQCGCLDCPAGCGTSGGNERPGNRREDDKKGIQLQVWREECRGRAVARNRGISYATPPPPLSN